jgi:hypothetical protein
MKLGRWSAALGAAGWMALLGGTATAAGALTLDRVVVAKTPGGPALEPAVFAPGESAHLRVEVREYEARDGKPELAQDLRITMPGGLVVVDKKDAGGIVLPATRGAPAAAKSTFMLPRSPPGRWTVSMTVHDRVAATSVTADFTLELRAATPSR